MKQVVVEKNAGNIYVGDSPALRVDSIINEVLTRLAAQPFAFARKPRNIPSVTMQKIQYNGIDAKRHIVKQYIDHSTGIELAYAGLDSLVPFGKQIILQNLHDLYFAALDAVDIDYMEGPVDLIELRDNAEFILDFITQKLRNIAYESRNTPTHVEIIERGINVIVAHAFIECVIFEAPE